MQERDRIYAGPDATDADYMKAAELEVKFGEYGGYDAEARAGSILSDIGIAESLHERLMRPSFDFAVVRLSAAQRSQVCPREYASSVPVREHDRRRAGRRAAEKLIPHATGPLS